MKVIFNFVISINKGCFGVGTETGFMIYNTNPLELTYQRGLLIISLMNLIIRDWRRNRDYLNAF